VGRGEGEKRLKAFTILKDKGGRKERNLALDRGRNRKSEPPSSNVP